VKLSIVGAGYVGLVTAACLARLGNTVRVVDIDGTRVEELRHGRLPIREPGLDEMVADGVAAGRLSFHDEPTAVRDTELVVVAVGTLDGDDQWTDRNVRRAVLDIASDPRAPRWVVIRSTLLPGTARSIATEVATVDAVARVALNPEFTREGSAVADFMAPDRVVIGIDHPAGDDATVVIDPDGAALVAAIKSLYEPLRSPFVVADLTSAETIKVASNVFLAAKISYANELARLCAATGADVRAVVDGIGLDRRIGRDFLSPGPGYGGSCLPSQARALPAVAARHGVETPLMSAIDRSNREQSAWLVALGERALGRSFRGARVTVLGLTFKAGTDDLRESPALRLATQLGAQGARLVAFDPLATGAGVAMLRAEGVDVSSATTPEEACAGADVVFVATEWRGFAELDWPAIAETMAGDLVVDGRGIIPASLATPAGLRRVGIDATPPASVPVAREPVAAAS
jgi:UDPglucose 6-dehydrogenase